MQENNYRILLIDDMPSIHEDFRKILNPDYGHADVHLEEMHSKLFSRDVEKRNRPLFEIDSAYQGEEGVALAQEAIKQNRPYAVAFVDVQMPPGEDGIDTIEKIWKIDQNIQTVICTAYANYTWEDIYRRFGETDRLFIIKKPCDNQEILQLATTLAKKWNNDRRIEEQLASVKKTPTTSNPQLDRSIHSMDEAVQHLISLNEELKNKARSIYKPKS